MEGAVQLITVLKFIYRPCTYLPIKLNKILTLIKEIVYVKKYQALVIINFEKQASMAQLVVFHEITYYSSRSVGGILGHTCIYLVSYGKMYALAD